LGDHYQIVRQLGNGDSGHIYQAEDTKQFSQPCVLKEFAPSSKLLMLYSGRTVRARSQCTSSTPTDPRFRELVRVNLDEKDYLFLVQDYESVKLTVPC
jgi:serine/threonine-protein kinase